MALFVYDAVIVSCVEALSTFGGGMIENLCSVPAGGKSVNAELEDATERCGEPPPTMVSPSASSGLTKNVCTEPQTPPPPIVKPFETDPLTASEAGTTAIAVGIPSIVKASFFTAPLLSANGTPCTVERIFPRSFVRLYAVTLAMYDPAGSEMPSMVQRIPAELFAQPGDFEVRSEFFVRTVLPERRDTTIEIDFVSGDT